MDNGKKKMFIGQMTSLYAEKGDTYDAPVFSREMHAILKKLSGNHDPYRQVKKEYNDIGISLYKKLKTEAFGSDDPFVTALRLAVAGNIIDFGAHKDFNIYTTIEEVIHADFGIDHTEYLKSLLKTSKSVLYLGDNAGEIVFDKLFIEICGHDNITFAVRGEPIINDVTMEDADYVGMHNVAKLISNGYDAPSTILDKCSAEFRTAFNRADLIISKGQGNLEGLIDVKDKKIFFMLMTKCDVIADLLNVKKGDFIAAYNGLLINR